MDGGWHPATCAGPERPRLGQQPYDRGRRGCFHCGQDGHIQKQCPNLDNRYGDSDRFTDRSTVGGNGRWVHDSWASSRFATAGGKEYGISRTDSFREGSSSRRPHLDYENGDFGNQRPRDMVDRHRDEGRDYGVVTAGNANVRERDYGRDRDHVREKDYSRERDYPRERDSKVPRNSSRKPADDNHQAAEGHRGEERRANKGNDGELHAGKSSANGNTLGQSPSHHLAAGGDSLRVKKEAKEDRPISKFSGSDVDLVPNGHLVRQITAGSDKEREGSAYEKGSSQFNDIGGERGMECIVDQTTRTRASSKRLAISKLPLSVLCKDAAEGNLERNYQQEQSVSSSAFQSVVPLEPILSSSGQDKDGEAAVVVEPMLSSSVQGKDGEVVIVEEPRLSSSSVETKDGAQGISVEPNPSSLGQSKDEEEIAGAELIPSSSGQARVGQDGVVVEPILSSSGRDKDGTVGVVEGRGDKKMNCPSPRLDEEFTLNDKDCEMSISPHHSREVEGVGTKEKDGGEERVAYELHKRPDGQILSACDGIEGKSKRVSKWSVAEAGVEVRDSDKDMHVSRRDIKDPVVDAAAAEVSERVRPSALAEQDPESQLRDRVSVEDRSHGPGEDISDLERDRLRHHSEDSTSGRVSARRPFGETYDEPEWNWRHSEPVWHSRESESYFRRGGNEYDQNGRAIDGAKTPVRGRHHSRDRVNTVDGYIGWCSREGSLDKTSDRNDYTTYGRTGLKAKYLPFGYQSGYDKALPSDFHYGDGSGEHHGWGLADWRQSRLWEAHPGHSQYRPGSYMFICNARFYQLRRRSPPSRHATVPLDPIPSSRHSEEGYNKDWMHHDSHGILQRPVALPQIEESVDDGKLQSECLVQQEGSDHRVTGDHTRTPYDSNIASRYPETKQRSVTRSPRLSEASVQQSCAPSGQDLLRQEHCNIEPSDRDICPPGTEANGADPVDEDFGDFQIDERVEMLMEGRNLIPGKEKEIVYEALSIASRRVQQDDESDIAVEESPRSHGGFDIGDRWKDGDFGSDVQGLEGFGFDQQLTKVDAKTEDVGVGAGSEGAPEVASVAPEPTTRFNTAVRYHSESKQESWKWPTRGGDWKLVWLDSSQQHTKGETHGTVEKGFAGYPRKTVMNGGHPLCGSSSKNLRDPRKQHQEFRAAVAEPIRLQLPKFSLKPLLPKVENNFAEDHNAIHTLHSVTALKGAMTPRSQGSTPRAHLSTPVKDRAVSLGLTAGFKVNKPGKNNSTQGLTSGAGGIKSLGQAKQQQALNKGSKVGTPAIKRELSGNAKNCSVLDNRGPHVQLKSSSDNVVETVERKSNTSLPDGSLEKTPPLNPHLQGSDLELSKSANATPLKKFFLSRSVRKEELDLEGHDVAIKAAAKGGSGKWQEAKELSVITALGIPVSPALSVLTPAALNGAPSTMSHLSVTEDSHSKDLTAEDSPKYEKRFLDLTTEQASSSAYDVPRANGARIVEVEILDGVTPAQQDVSFVDGGAFRSKRKAPAVEDGEASKQRHRSIHKRRILGNEYSEVDRKPAALSSPVTHLHSSMSPHALEVHPLGAQEQAEHKFHGQKWAALKPSILCTIFRFLRGDVKTLVNAMASCRSWLATGERFKTQLKRADLSSVQEQSLDAVLESLPGFGAGKLRRVILKGCNVSPESLGHLLRACPSISAVEIGCDETLKELICSFPNVRWLGDQNGVQSPKEGLSRKREVSRLKTRSLKFIGVRHRLRDSSSRDGGESEMHPVSDSASKARSPNGYTSVVSTVEETEIIESYQDSGVTHMTHSASDGVKLLKLNNGGTIVKSNGVNGSMKAGKHENGNIVSRPQQLNRKVPAGLLHRKHDKASYRMLKPVMGVQRPQADKHSSTTSVKVEHHSRSTISTLSEGDKTLEKEIRLILRLMMEADINKCFQSANVVATDGKGTPSVSEKAPDLLLMEKKLKGGAYAGGVNGFKAFKEDVTVLYRRAFRNQQDKLIFSAGQKIFKLAHQQFQSLESQIAGTDSNNQGKLPGSRLSSSKAKSSVLIKNDSMLQHRPNKKRKAWDDDGILKGKFGVAKKSRQGESNSGDVDSGSDSTEQESRKLTKSKRQELWESEGDSSEDDEEFTFMEEDEETETEASDSDVPSESEGEDGMFEDENYDSDDTQLGYHDWGARMTKAAMVPPVTRKYVVIEEYRIVADKERVEQKMKVELPQDYEEKLQAAKDKRTDSYSHLDIPETRDYQPRKKLGEEVLEQEVYGIDPYTHNLLWDAMPPEITDFSDIQRQQYIEERLLLTLNREAKQYTGSGKAPMEFNLERVVERIKFAAELEHDWALQEFSEQLLTNMRNRPKDKFVAYRKGLGVVCNKANGLEKDEFVVEFFGEVYPPWRWYEKQDGIRSLQKKDKDTTPEFYNIFYERPKGDAAGYDLLVVDAMHKANFASRLCHSCRPNCEAKITAVNNTYIIGVYTLKPIKRGEELTFDYNSVTESKEEYNNAVCLCGSQGCRGSYLNLTGSGTFEEVILKHHGLLDRHRLLLDSCTATSVTDEGLKEMRQAGLGSCLLSGLPPWVLKYAAGLVHFMNIEKTLLPGELLKDLELKLKQGVVEGCTEENAEITTEGVYNQRLQNLAITLDKVRHILTKIYKNPNLAPPPLRKLDQKDVVQWIWKRDDSVVNELLQCLGPHLEEEPLSNLKQKTSKHRPHDSGNNLMECLLWLRDELRKLSSTCKARHDAAADLIHIYAYTKTFFLVEDYAVVESSSMNIHPLDLGSSRHSISGPRVWHKTYSKEYVWGQLIGWYKQSVADPGASLAKAGRGCLTLPDVSACYAKSMQHDFRLGYGQKHREKMICQMEEKPQQKWPTSKSWSQAWSFKNERGLFGSPMLDSVLEDKPLDYEMLEWLKTRKNVFTGPWDEQ